MGLYGIGERKYHVFSNRVLTWIFHSNAWLLSFGFERKIGQQKASELKSNGQNTGENVPCVILSCFQERRYVLQSISESKTFSDFRFERSTGLHKELFSTFIISGIVKLCHDTTVIFFFFFGGGGGGGEKHFRKFPAFNLSSLSAGVYGNRSK